MSWEDQGIRLTYFFLGCCSLEKVEEWDWTGKAEISVRGNLCSVVGTRMSGVLKQ